MMRRIGRQVMFYRDFAAGFPLKTCKHLAAFVDDAEPWRWCLLLENLATEDMTEFPLWFGNPTVVRAKSCKRLSFKALCCTQFLRFDARL